MDTIRNLLAVLGLIAIVIFAFMLFHFVSFKSQFSDFDPQAWDTYKSLYDKLMETGDAAEATVWKVKVQEGLTVDDVETSIRLIANENNIKNVGELPLYKQVEAMTEKPYRFVKIYMFCNALTAAKMIDHNDAYSAYLPCRLSLVQDKTGALWLYTLNMDLMIHGGKPLPEALKKDALRVKKIMLDVMNRGAEGDF